MIEKISETHIRQEKVNQLKAKLIKQIPTEVNRNLLALTKIFSGTKDQDEIRYLVNETHALYVLETFLRHEGTFMHYHDVRKDLDMIVYKVSVNAIDWMLQNENLLSDVLFHIEDNGGCAEALLCDEFFERKVFSAIEMALWDKKKEKGKR